MCGRIVRINDEGYRDYFNIDEFSDTQITPRFNIAPTQLDLMIHDQEDGRRLLSASRWGLIPGWAKDRSIGSKMFNARAETLTERPAFRNLIGRTRCVIPATGFYEWQAQGKAKQPLYIFRRDGKPLAMAGLWTIWKDPDSGEPVVSHTIITRGPNGFMEQIHNRMPALLDRDAIDAWLDPGLKDSAAAQALLTAVPDDFLDAYPVDKFVNNVRNDGPELIERLAGAAR